MKIYWIVQFQNYSGKELFLMSLIEHPFCLYYCYWTSPDIVQKWRKYQVAIGQYLVPWPDKQQQAEIDKVVLEHTESI